MNPLLSGDDASLCGQIEAKLRLQDAGAAAGAIVRIVLGVEVPPGAVADPNLLLFSTRRA